VSGHSLGGYLAVAVKARYGARVSGAYLFNAPGSGGLLGTLGDLLCGVLTQSAPGENGIWNLKASEGASLMGAGGRDCLEGNGAADFLVVTRVAQEQATRDRRIPQRAAA